MGLPFSRLLAALSAGGTPGLEFQSHVTSMMASIRGIGTTRSNIGYHGMSIIAGVGSNGNNAFTWATAWRTASVPAVLGAALTTAYGGTQALGIELISLAPAAQSTFFTAGGAATLVGLAAAGSGGVLMSLPGGGTAQVALTVTGARAGQVVRLHSYCNTVGMTPRYSISGANTVAQSNLPITTSAAPLPTGVNWWYDTDITLVNSGDSTITLYASATSGHNLGFFGANPDYRTDAGITIHRLAQSGAGLATCIAAALDNTDTYPNLGVWLGSGNANIRASQTQSMTTRVGLNGIVCSFDVNDCTQSANYASISDVTRHYTNYASAMAALSLPVIFIAGVSIRNPSSLSSNYTQQQVIDAIRAVAAASSNCALIDLTSNWAGADMQTKYNAQVTPTTNWLAAESPNYLHPAATGHAIFGNLASARIVAAP